MESYMFDKMKQLPFLQGMSVAEFDSILKFMKLDFKTYNEGDCIVHQGDKADNLIYVIDGKFEAEHQDMLNSFVISEISTASPYLIEPHNLFSIQRRYDRTYSFLTRGSTFTISKEFFTSRLLDHKLIRSNLINHLCNELSKMQSRVRFSLSADIEQRIADFIRSYTTMKNAETHLHISMDTLACMTDETRLNVSKVLNKWNDQGIIILKRLYFIVPDTSLLPK